MGIEPRDLSGRICIVTGASRGIGKGVALALAGMGAHVYASARTGTAASSGHDPDQQGSLAELVSAAAGLPGRIVTKVVDHADDAQTRRFVSEAIAEAGRVDLLVNNAWPGYESMVEYARFTWIDPFWQQPMWRWSAMIDTGLRAAFVAAQAVAPRMIEQRSGLIVNISYWAARKHIGNVVYGIAKAAADKMAADMAHELEPFGIAALALYPGLVRTEAVLRNAAYMDLSNSESPHFVGRAIAGLMTDPALMTKSGRVQIAAELGRDYAIADIDGRQPIPLTEATA